MVALRRRSCEGNVKTVSEVYNRLSDLTPPHPRIKDFVTGLDKKSVNGYQIEGHEKRHAITVPIRTTPGAVPPKQRRVQNTPLSGKPRTAQAWHNQQIINRPLILPWLKKVFPSVDSTDFSKATTKHFSISLSTRSSKSQWPAAAETPLALAPAAAVRLALALAAYVLEPCIQRDGLTWN